MHTVYECSLVLMCRYYLSSSHQCVDGRMTTGSVKALWVVGKEKRSALQVQVLDMSDRRRERKDERSQEGRHTSTGRSITTRRTVKITSCTVNTFHWLRHRLLSINTQGKYVVHPLCSANRRLFWLEKCQKIVFSKCPSQLSRDNSELLAMQNSQTTEDISLSVS